MSAVFGVGSLVLFLPGMFTDFDVTEKEKAIKASRGELVRNEDSDAGVDLPPPNYGVIAVLLFCFWEYFANFVILET